MDTTVIETALNRRATLIAAGTTVRLLDGELHRDLTADKLGPVILLHWRGSAEFPFLEVGRQLALSVNASTVYLRRHSKNPKDGRVHEAELIFGERCDEAVINEGKIRAIIRPERQVNAGIFVDMREIRSALLSVCAGKRVLNLFSFTGLLGVAACLGQAEEVRQVDISKSALRWSKENAQLNKCSAIKHIAEDVRRYVARMVKRKELFDVILLDAPAFGHGRKVFSVERELAPLIRDCKKILSSHGTMLITCNSKSKIPSKIAKMYDGPNSPVLPPTVDFTAPLNLSAVMRGIWGFSASKQKRV